MQGCEEKEKVLLLWERALTLFYENDTELFVTGAQERTIAGKIAMHMDKIYREIFPMPELVIDIEYNRMDTGIKPKYPGSEDKKKRWTAPDIVLHKRRSIPKNERRLKSVEEHLKMLEQEEQKYQTLRRQLYEDMSSGIVSKEEYKEFSHSFNEKVEAIRKAKAEMNRQRDCLNNLDVEHLPWIEDFKSYQNLTSLNRRVLVELVESITVYDKEHIHIQYRFDQEIRNVLEYYSSVPAAETEESAV